METKSKVCVFVGYPKETKGGMFYDPQDQKVFVSANAIYLEEEYVMEHRPSSKVVLEELRGSNQSNPAISEQRETIDSIAQSQEKTPREPRRSGRNSKIPDRYYGDALMVDPEFQEDDPTTYKSAIESPDRDAWLKAM
ncbi:hypothetical protein ACFFKJ_28195, partial [Pelagicoccus mobilis]|uniref:hypothetical protein n=1 Tax=Pelagicoccus mobilis TaxID=415221 RepID=UPI0035EA02D6